MKKEIIVENWLQTGLLQGVKEENIERLALVLHSQFWFNESNDVFSSFKKVSIPLVRRALHELNVISDNQYTDNEDYGEPEITNIEWEEVCTKNLDVWADKVAVIAIDLKNLLKEKFGDKFFNFKAFGVVQDGEKYKIAIYGLKIVDN